MKRKALSAVLIAVLLVFTAMPVFALSLLGENAYVTDGAGLLTAEEAEKLSAELEEISSRLDFDVVALTTNGLEGKTPQAYADDFYDSHGYREDGALLLIDMESHAWHVTTSGYGIEAITDYGIDLIGQEITPKLRAGNYYEAFSAFGKQCDYFVTQANEGSAVDVPYASEPAQAPAEKEKKMPGVGALGFAGAIGALVSGLRTKRMKGQLQTVREEYAAGNYVQNGSMQLRASRDDFLYRNVTRTPRPKEPRASHGGSTTHVSSSGHTHGGGGGHF